MAGIVNISDSIKNRIGWADDLTVGDFLVSAEAALAEGLRYFQDAHPAITISNIKATMPLKSATNDQINDYLVDFKRVVSQRVLSDVYDAGNIPQNVVSLYPDAFDRAILLMGVIRFSEIVFTSVNRSNVQERFSKDFIAKLHYDIFREAPNKFAVRDANYQHALGITTQYGTEIASLQRRFGKSRNVLDSATAGQAIPNYFGGNVH